MNKTEEEHANAATGEKRNKRTTPTTTTVITNSAFIPHQAATTEGQTKGTKNKERKICKHNGGRLRGQGQGDRARDRGGGVLQGHGAGGRGHVS